jgi:hypothetical protein
MTTATNNIELNETNCKEYTTEELNALLGFDNEVIELNEENCKEYTTEEIDEMLERNETKITLRREDKNTHIVEYIFKGVVQDVCQIYVDCFLGAYGEFTLDVLNDTSDPYNIDVCRKPVTFTKKLDAKKAAWKAAKEVKSIFKEKYLKDAIEVLKLHNK